uniref:Ubiquitin-like domain-containing protein n=1 Tax=Panagrellus redivivus TaxID=6233 RepID=A0A7E4VV45_PANRE
MDLTTALHGNRDVNQKMASKMADNVEARSVFDVAAAQANKLSQQLSPQSSKATSANGPCFLTNVLTVDERNNFNVTDISHVIIKVENSIKKMAIKRGKTVSMIYDLSENSVFTKKSEVHLEIKPFGLMSTPVLLLQLRKEDIDIALHALRMP